MSNPMTKEEFERELARLDPHDECEDCDHEWHKEEGGSESGMKPGDVVCIKCCAIEHQRLLVNFQCLLCRSLRWLQ